MKRFLLGILLLGLLFTVSGCKLIGRIYSINKHIQTEVDRNKIEIVMGKALSKVDIADEYDIDGESLNTYSHKDDLGISYVNIQEFLGFLKGGIIDLEVDKTDILKLSYTISVDEEYRDIVGSDEYTYEIIFDAKTNKVNFSDFDILADLNVEMESDYLTDITTVGLDVPNQDYAYEIDLNKYDLEIVLHENNYYIPLYLANLFFTGAYMNVYEMGNQIYLIDNFSDFSSLIFNFQNNETDDLDTIKKHTTKYLAFYFDHFYGLKDYQMVDSYLDVVPNFETEKTFDTFYKKIDQFLMGRNDLHTSLITAGYRNRDYVKSTEILPGAKIDTYLNAYKDYSCFERNEELTYSIKDNAMIIEVNAFTLNTKNLIKLVMEETKNYDDIIFDLSCNSGGALAGVLEVLVYLTDQPIPMSYTNPVTDTEYTEYYQSSSSKYIDKNYYLRTSGVTFSAANLFTSLFKDMNLGPIMGTDTSGGAAAITYTVLPDGAIIVNSSNMVLMNENKEVIEDGIKTDIYSSNSPGWWKEINRYKNTLGNYLKFHYENQSDNLNFNFSLKSNELDFEIEEFILTFKNYYTGETVKEYVFTDYVLVDSFKKPEDLDHFEVSLSAKYKYKTIYSEQLINLGVVDEDLDIVGNYSYKEVTVGEPFTLNTLNDKDIDVVRLNITKSGLYKIESKSGLKTVELYDSSYRNRGSMGETELLEGTYYISIENKVVGDHEYTIKHLVDDNEGKTIINLVNGDNQNNVTLDYHDDDETFEFTLDQDKIITLSFNHDLSYKIFDAEGREFDDYHFVYSGKKDYTYLFPKGTYTVKVNSGRGLVTFSANVSDVSSDLYTDDFSKVNEFGKLSIGENSITLDYNGDQDIYYVDITEKGSYLFEGEQIDILKMDENGDSFTLAMKNIFELEAGRHYFVFLNYNNHKKSIMQVELNLYIDESDENNHVSINLGEQITTKLINYLDKDYFDFTISEAGLYKISLISDVPHVMFDVFNEKNEKILGLKFYNQEITLSEGNYTIVLYQPETNGNQLRYATFTISK